MFVTFYKREEKVINNYSIIDYLNNVDFNKIETIKNTKITVETTKNPKSFDIENLHNIVTKLKTIADKYINKNIDDYYYSFLIPKKTGGFRRIEAPVDELKTDLKEMLRIIQDEMRVLVHSSAYAYEKNKTFIDALKVHQRNSSNWFLKLDLKDFFGSCTEELVIQKMMEIYPFNNLTYEEIQSFIWICFKDNHLPQGTPISPFITNLIMVPFDYKMTAHANKNKLRYTRYADDIIISSYLQIEKSKTEKYVERLLELYYSGLKIKHEKTRYGSKNGRNWNLGLMYNKDRDITVGYRRKKIYKAMLNNLFKSIADGVIPEKDELYHFQGVTAYYKSIEPIYFNKIIEQYQEKFNIRLSDIYKKFL
ncbi:MAG: reverse transcriptase family protein [Clostridium sp.]|nr:reverse transcriptase family protein [Clostridium sp.]